MRRTQSFVKFAQEHDEWFDVLELDDEERIAMGDKDRFFRNLAERSEDFQAGDVVLVHGMTPWDEEKAHSHIMFIYETDPMTGVPILVAGNAGPANLWSWETEARRTPARSIRQRIRPRTDGLDAHLLAPRSELVAAELLPLPRQAAAPLPRLTEAEQARLEAQRPPVATEELEAEEPDDLDVALTSAVADVVAKESRRDDRKTSRVALASRGTMANGARRRVAISH
jgi:hypothetical protein